MRYSGVIWYGIQDIAQFDTVAHDVHNLNTPNITNSTRGRLIYPYDHLSVRISINLILVLLIFGRLHLLVLTLFMAGLLAYRVKLELFIF